MSIEAAIKRVTQLNAQVGSTIEECLNTRSRSGSTKRLRDTVESISSTVQWLKENQKRAFVDVRKRLVIVSNSFTGLADGLSDGDLSREELRSTLNNVRNKFYPNIQASLSTEVDRLNEGSEHPVSLTPAQESVKKSLSISDTDWKTALKTVKEVLHNVDTNDTPATDDTPAEVQELHNMGALRSRLPVKLKGAYEVLRMPVVPLFSSYALNNPASFKKLGIPHLLVEGYGVLKDQVLLLVSKRIAAKAGLSTDKYAEAALEFLNEKGNLRYELVSEQCQINPRNADIAMYWIMPAHKVSALNKMAGNQLGSVKWGLPF